VSKVDALAGSKFLGALKTQFVLDGQTVLGLLDTPNLAHGAYATISVNWSTAGISKGKHTIKVTADRNNAVTESTETNNTRSLTLMLSNSTTRNQKNKWLAEH